MTSSAPPLDSASVHRAPAWMMPYPSGVGESCIQQATPHFTTPEILAVPTDSRETYAKNCLVSFLEDVSLAARVLKDRCKEEDGSLTIQCVDFHIIVLFSTWQPHP